VSCCPVRPFTTKHAACSSTDHGDHRAYGLSRRRACRAASQRPGPPAPAPCREQSTRSQPARSLQSKRPRTPSLGAFLVVPALIACLARLSPPTGARRSEHRVQHNRGSSWHRPSRRPFATPIIRRSVDQVLRGRSSGSFARSPLSAASVQAARGTLLRADPSYGGRSKTWMVGGDAT
jgi:hypothetical protein